MLWLYDFESPDRRKYLISCEVARYSMLQITRTWKWFYSLAHNTVFFYLKDHSSLLILSIIYFYVLWVFCLHVCARSPGTGVKDSCDLSCGCWESSLVLWKSSQRIWTAEPTLQPLLIYSGMGLFLRFDWSLHTEPLLPLTCCSVGFLCSWLALDTVAGPCELFHFCFLLCVLLLRPFELFVSSFNVFTFYFLWLVFLCSIQVRVAPTVTTWSNKTPTALPRHPPAASPSDTQVYPSLFLLEHDLLT